MTQANTHDAKASNSAEFADLIDKLRRELDRLPDIATERLRRDLDELLELVRDRRPPRFLLAGRRGAGKSTLLNAVFGHKTVEVGAVSAQTGRASWHTFHEGGKSIELLDTRGWAEGGKPSEADEAGDAFESISNAMKEKRPDIILFIVPARSVDAHIDDDLEELERILATASDLTGGALPLVAVVTQCDQLDPIDEKLPTSDEEKMGNVKEARRVLEKHVTKRPDLNERLAGVLPVAAWARYKRDGSLDPRRDYRWNIDKLVGSLLDELPNDARLDFARLARVKQFQRTVAMRIVDVSSAACGAVGSQPIPVADLPVLTSIQTVMILGIAYVSGRELSFSSARELAIALGGNVGAAFGVREGVRALLKLVPGAGNIASGAVAGGATYIMGRAAVSYFIDQLDEERIRATMEKEAEELGASAG